MISDSSSRPEPPIMPDGLAFFGRISASVSHELNNVISIIDQTAGLLEDLLAGAERGRPITNDRLESIVHSLQKQTQRGLTIIKRLNTFAHGTDSPRLEFDINDAMTNLGDLCQRLAGLKRVTLQLHLNDSPLTVVGSPFAVQQAVFGAIMQSFAVAERDATIALTTGSIDNGSSIEVSGPVVPADQMEFDIATVTAFIADMGGNAGVTTDSEQTVFSFTFPLKT